MPKLAKSVQIRHRASKCVANVWRWRTPAGDRSAVAVCLAMIYTVYKGLGFGMGAVARDFHDTAHIVYVGLLFSTRGNQID